MSMNALQKACDIVPHDSKKSSNPSSSSAMPAPLSVKNSTVPAPQSLESAHVMEIHKLASNTNLSITPVTGVLPPPPQKTVNTNNVDSVKSRHVNTSDITINKIEARDISTSKSNSKPLPDIIKTSNSLTITPATTLSMKPSSERMKRIDFAEPCKEVSNPVVVEDVHVKQHGENNNLLPSKSKESGSHYAKSEISNKSESGHCQVIDLTESLTPDIKKKSSQKLKSKPFEPEKKGTIRVKTDLMKSKSEMDEITPKICESLTEMMQQNMSRASSSTSSASISPHGKAKEQYSPFSTTPPLDYQKMKQTSEGDEIHKAMENLKALQRLSSPAKANETLTSSPVSVIAFNKSYSPKGVLHNAGPLPPQVGPNAALRTDYKADFGSGFQEVFQRQFLSDFNLMQSSVNHSAPTSSKSHYNRCS